MVEKKKKRGNVFVFACLYKQYFYQLSKNYSVVIRTIYREGNWITWEQGSFCNF